MSNFTDPSDMYFDVSSFDFDSLEDVVEVNHNGHEDKSPKQQRQTQKAPVKQAPADNGYDFIEDEGDYNDEDDELLEYNPNDDVSDLLQEPEFDPSATEYFDAVPDDARIHIGGGMHFTKQELRELASGKNDIDEGANFFRGGKDTWEGANEQIRNALNAFITETDITLEQIERKMRHHTTTESERGSLWNEQQRYLGRKAQINEKIKEIENARRIQEDNMVNWKLREADNVMRKTYGSDWNPDAAFDYARAEGMSIPEIRAALSPALTKIIIKAMKADAHEVTLKNRMKTAMPKAARSTNSTKERSSVSETTARKNSAIRNMGSSRDANMKAFDFLID